MATGHYFDLAVETNGIFWLASAEGLLRYSPPLWKSPRAIQRLNSPVPCLAEDSESRLWFASAGSVALAGKWPLSRNTHSPAMSA